MARIGHLWLTGMCFVYLFVDLDHDVNYHKKKTRGDAPTFLQRQVHFVNFLQEFSQREIGTSSITKSAPKVFGW